MNASKESTGRADVRRYVKLWRYVSTPPAAASTICTAPENSDTQALGECSSEGEAASKLEKLAAKQV